MKTMASPHEESPQEIMRGAINSIYNHIADLDRRLIRLEDMLINDKGPEMPNDYREQIP